MPASDGPIIELRDVAEEDLPILFEHQIDPEATRMAAFKPRERDEFMAHWKEKILVDGSVIKKVILAGGKVAGNVLSFERDGRREVGYWLGREYWGLGIASEALRRFLHHDPSRPLHAVVARHNAASLRVLEKCGFTIESETFGTPGGRGLPGEEYILRLPGRPDEPDGEGDDPGVSVLP